MPNFSWFYAVICGDITHVKQAPPLFLWNITKIMGAWGLKLHHCYMYMILCMTVMFSANVCVLPNLGKGQ